jgi:hypothetical protein
VHGVSGFQGWEYACPQHVQMYRKRKRTKTDTSVDGKDKGTNQARTGG